MLGVQQVQGGRAFDYVENESVAIKEFLGFFQSMTDAVAAIHRFGYELYGEGL